MKSSGALMIIFLLLLTACADSSSTSQSNTNGNSTGSSDSHNSAITLTVGTRSGTESQLISKFYALLLRQAGFTVAEHAPFDTADAEFKAITSKQIDIYPEYTPIGLAQLKLLSTGNAEQDYLQVKQGFAARDQVSWLDRSPLNDAFTICMTRARASTLQTTKISDLATQSNELTIATTREGVQGGLDALKSTYGLNFKKVVIYPSDASTFQAVRNGVQDLNICRITSAGIVKSNFVALRDEKHASATYNLAPLVRDEILKMVPQLAQTLNKLSPFLTTKAVQQLQVEVENNGQSVTVVATQFLRQKGLL